MKRRSFILRCAAIGVALGPGGRKVLGASQERTQNAVLPKSPSVSGSGTLGGSGDHALTYVGSYATPTLTDTYVKPNKTAKLDFGKHTKMAYCPANGHLYTCGGDGRGQHWGGFDSGTMDTVGRYDIGTHTYTEDFLYRGHAGEPVPRGLDYTAFTWAPSLKEFWLGPGYAWNYTDRTYPWVDFSWTTRNFASYNPVTKRFTDRGPKPAGVNYEGFAGSWDTTRDRLVFVTNQSFKSLNPHTREITSVGLKISSHVVHTADTWYDADTDELYFVQIATGKVYGYKIATNVLRLVATVIGTTISSENTIAVIYMTDSKRCLLVYSARSINSTSPWKLVDLTTGEVQHLNLFPPGITNHNTGVYHPPTKTIVLTGGSNDGNRANGTAFHHYRSNL